MQCCEFSLPVHYGGTSQGGGYKIYIQQLSLCLSAATYLVWSPLPGPNLISSIVLSGKRKTKAIANLLIILKE